MGPSAASTPQQPLPFFFSFFLLMTYLPYFKPELGGPAALTVWILPCSGKGFEVFKKWRRQLIPEGSERLLGEPWRWEMEKQLHQSQG